MAKLVYITNTSLDGYIEDASGSFDWGNPEQVHDFITGLMRSIRTYLCGRRHYETMSYWDAEAVESYAPEHRAFARLWQDTQKIVFSRTLTGVTSGNARIEREFDVDAIRKLKEESNHDIGIAGAELAGLALEADLIDECHLFLHPVIVGRGKPAFRTALQRSLELLETRRFDTGVVHVRYGFK